MRWADRAIRSEAERLIGKSANVGSLQIGFSKVFSVVTNDLWPRITCKTQEVSHIIA
jgi:hypothetical protein